MDQNKKLSNINIIKINDYINELMVLESSNPAIKVLCKEYYTKLKNGEHDENLCESFAIDLAKTASSNGTKKILNKLTNAIKENETNLKIANAVYDLYEGACTFVAPVIESAVVDYLVNKNEQTRNGVRAVTELFESDKSVATILETLSYESYQEKNGNALTNAVLKATPKVNEAKTYTQEEVDEIIKNKINEANEEEPVKKTHRSIKTNIQLDGTIKSILKENKNNEKLKVFCEQYLNALNNGKSEIMLYEAFISGISNWNYLNAVDTEISAMNDRISKYKQNIDLKKILETMEQTESYYIVPLIEDVVADYAENKTPTNRAILLQRLEVFEYDTFVRDIINAVSRDQSINANVCLGESLESSNSYIKTEDAFSPLNYINENECAFNVKGTYYVRRGNGIVKLTNKQVGELSESFKSLCRLVNSNNVKVSNQDNTITVYDGNNVAVISESAITINGNKVSTDELNNLQSKAELVMEDSASFYKNVAILAENFNNIAHIDFVRHAETKDNSGKAVDVFRLNESLYVNTIDRRLGHSTFYRNVNPIQCRNYINEHFEIKVSPIFEDILPDQENIEKRIDDKDKEYQAYIDDLEKKKAAMISMKNEDDDADDIDKYIDAIDKEIEDTKADYKKFQSDAQDFLNGKDADADDSLKDEIPNADDDDDDKDSDSETNDDEKKGDSMDMTKETPDEMSEPITNTDSDGEFNPDAFGLDSEEDDKDYSDVAEFDPDFDVLPSDKTKETIDSEETDNVGAKPNASFEIAKVSYNKNVKTGESTGKGEVILIIPSVDSNGDVHDEMRKVTFYLDSDRSPVVNNDYMPLDMYEAIVSAIEECPDTETVNINGETETPETTSVPAPTTAPAQLPSDSSTATDSSVDVSNVFAETSKTDDKTDTDASFDFGDDDWLNDVKKEAPAETRRKDSEDANYPITVGLYPEEIAPKDMDDFESDLDDMKISHSESEAKDGEVCLKIDNKAQAHALKKYFYKWMNYSDGEFVNFFPELKKCFDNKPSNIPVAATNESATKKRLNRFSSNKNRYLCAVLPMNESIAKHLGVKYDTKTKSFGVYAESDQESRLIYSKLYEYASSKRNVEMDVLDTLRFYKKRYGRLSEGYKLALPYNGFLEQKLESKGLLVESTSRAMYANVKMSELNKVKKLLESFYGKKSPDAAKNFYNFVNENVSIIVKDETTGKTVEINTDDINGSKSSKDEEDSSDVDFNSSFNSTTFNPEDNMIFKDDEESADDDDDEKDDKDDKSKDSDDKKDDESEDKDTSDDEESDDEEKEEKPKKKFKFKASKKKKSDDEKTDESLKIKKALKKLNESAQQKVSAKHAEPNVLDYVFVSGRKKGQIIAKQSDNNFIVNVDGHTLVCDKKSLNLANRKLDLMDTPFKYDPATLKGCYESFVSCGMFMNDMQCTPNDTKVQLLEFMNASDNDEINIIIEGTKTKALKKYIRLTENLNNVLDLHNYSKGKARIIVEGVATEADVLINYNDYVAYKNSNEETVPVRVLERDSSGETHLRYVSGSNLVLDNPDDEYTPVYEQMFNDAVEKLKN